MNAHTPGPWQIAKGPTQAILAPSPSERKGRYIQVIYFDGNDYKYQSPGDAHLIAAAPDLLALLKEYVRDYGDNEDSDSQLMAEKARAAIAKAEGRS